MSYLLRNLAVVDRDHLRAWIDFPFKTMDLDALQFTLPDRQPCLLIDKTKH